MEWTEIQTLHHHCFGKVERLLYTAVNHNEQPKYLIMENVPMLVSKKFIDSFNEWLEVLEKLGYKNYWQL